LRAKNKAATSENWHRDIHKEGLPTDLFFGGWINLSTQTDVFICKAGTHQADDLDDASKGFSKIDDLRVLGELNASHDRVTVPPGTIIVIDETILHKVNGKSSPVDKQRVFLAWRLTSAENTFYPADAEKVIEDQGVFTIKSGQIPPMWPATDNMYRVGELMQWGATQLKPSMLETRTRSDRAKVFPGQSLTLPKRFAPSLKEAGLSMYAQYEWYEKEIFCAKSSHQLPMRNSSEMRTVRYTPY